MSVMAGKMDSPSARRWYSITLLSAGLVAMTALTGGAAERVVLGEYFTAVW